MHFDFIDIGTCDFDTSINNLLNENSGKTALLVEPIKMYLDNLPSLKNTLKVNVAISNHKSRAKVFYLDEEIISKYNLPWYLRGCNSLHVIHKAVLYYLNDLNLSTDIVKSHEVDVITFQDLLNIYDIQSIGQLKIDTEGLDHLILPFVLEKIEIGFEVNTIIFEYQEMFHNTNDLDKLIHLFEKNGYKRIYISELDIGLSK